MRKAHSGGAKPRERAAFSLNAACWFHWALDLHINRMRVVHARLTEESELPFVHHSCSMSLAGRPDGIMVVEEVPQLSARDVV